MVKRAIAFYIDMVIVVFLADVLSMTPLNPKYEAFVELQTEFQKRSDVLSSKASKEQVDEFMVYYKENVLELNKLSIYSDLIMMTILILYFVVFSYAFDKETAGKRLMKLRVVNKDGDKVGCANLLVRVSLLYGIPLTIWNMIACHILDKDAFWVSYSISNLVADVLMLSIIIVTTFTVRNRGLHDLIARTEVIELERKK